MALGETILGRGRRLSHEVKNGAAKPVRPAARKKCRRVQQDGSSFRPAGSREED